MTTTKDDGGPAFPRHYGTASCMDLKEQLWHGGMSLRDFLAVHVLNGLLISMKETSIMHPKETVVSAYQFADAMIEYRNK
jgi:hypothetical protein